MQPNSGLSFTFPVFAAVIIGGASLTGGKGTIVGTIGGALLLAELQQGLALLSPGPHVQRPTEDEWETQHVVDLVGIV